MDSVTSWYYKSAVICIDSVGLLANVLLFTFLFFRRVGSHRTTMILKSQFLFNGLVSFTAIFLLIFDQNLQSSEVASNRFVCHVWNSHAVFWLFTLLSDCNLVCLSLDRLRAIVFPTTYKSQEKLTVIMCTVITWGYATLNCLPWVFTVESRDGKCLYKPQSNQFEAFTTAAYIWLFMGYLVPGFILIATNCLLVSRLVCLRNNATTTRKTNTPRIQVKMLQSVKIGRSIAVPNLIMSVAYVLTHSYHAIFCLLVAHGHVRFVGGSLEHLMGIFLTIINSSFNPIIILSSSPPFRNSLWAFISRAAHGKRLREETTRFTMSKLTQSSRRVHTTALCEEQRLLANVPDYYPPRSIT